MGARAGSAVLVAAVIVGLATVGMTTVGMTAAVAGGQTAPGTLLQADPIDAPAGAHAWRVQYTSRALDGHDVVESGVVVVPDGAPPSGGRPVVSWAHGTTGLADTCAPSLTPGVVDHLPWLHELLDRGVVIAATDYEGLGTPGPHPYLVGDSEGRSVLDIARAAQQVEGAGANNVVVAMGHSQGGHAALFAGELASRYAPDLDVRGVVALAPVADPFTLFSPSLPSFMRGFAPMVAAGIRVTSPNADIDAVMDPGAMDALPVLDADGCVRGTVAGFFDPSVPIFRKNPAMVPSVRAAVLRSTPGRRATTVPIAVFQGADDLIVPASATAAYVTRACALGDRVTSVVEAGGDHGSVITQSGWALFAWLDGRLAGDPPPSTC